MNQYQLHLQEEEMNRVFGTFCFYDKEKKDDNCIIVPFENFVILPLGSEMNIAVTTGNDAIHMEQGKLTSYYLFPDELRVRVDVPSTDFNLAWKKARETERVQERTLDSTVDFSTIM